jgi:hypothetical protein
MAGDGHDRKRHPQQIVAVTRFGVNLAFTHKGWVASVNSGVPEVRFE